MQFAQITQSDNGTILERVNLKRHLFTLKIVLKLKAVLKIVQFAQISQIHSGINLKGISSFCRFLSN